MPRWLKLLSIWGHPHSHSHSLSLLTVELSHPHSLVWLQQTTATCITCHHVHPSIPWHNLIHQSHHQPPLVTVSTLTTM